MFHRALLQDVTRCPLPDTHHHVLSHSLPGVGRFEPDIIAHIFTIHWGQPSPPFFESSFASGYSRLRCACDLGNAPWGMVGCTEFRIMGAGLRYAMCQWRSIPWECWNIIWHIQTLSTKDFKTSPLDWLNLDVSFHKQSLNQLHYLLTPTYIWMRKWDEMAKQNVCDFENGVLDIEFNLTPKGCLWQDQTTFSKLAKEAFKFDFESE